jgi:glycogen debranching enzyme
MTNQTSNSLQQEDSNLFFMKADKFLEKTTEYVHLGINPGDYYKAIWTRDAAFILKDQFLTGDTYNVLRSLYFIWTHQIDLNDEKVIYGRGSPELRFSSSTADRETKERFRGALPSTIYHRHGFSEVYARNPDIDSTALMISTTSWILDVYLKAGLYSYYENLQEWATISSSLDPSFVPESAANPLSSADYYKKQKSSLVTAPYNPPLEIIPRPIELIEFLVPRMLSALDYLRSRDIDNDGLLEQGYNEDWMDTALRAGKIVYSQASWILAVSNLSSLLYEIDHKPMARKLMAMAEKTVNAVEEKHWSEEDGAYIDLYNGANDTLSSYNQYNKGKRMLTQDTSLYLVSITENTFNDILGMRFNRDNDGGIDNLAAANKRKKQSSQLEAPKKFLEQRASSTLAALKNRVWLDSRWPLVTEKEWERTGPWHLDSNQYHNHTFWPWITGIEMLARSRFKRYRECNELLSILTQGNHPQTLAFYEWINPKTGGGHGAFPFRTGISTIRVALTDVMLSRL